MFFHRAQAAEGVVMAPVPALDAKATRATETAVFAGGCYWGIEGVFSHIKGVRSARPGFAGGPRGRKVTYEQVSGGDTGFAEAVQVTYDPKVVSYGTLMRVFFSVMANPTTLNYQGPDHGTQYRSALFPLDAEQGRAASAYLAQLGKSGIWHTPIVTRIERFAGFVDAAADHQDFMERNPRNPYILAWDVPKLAALKRLYPTLYSAKAAR
ncbi:MAG: peptide-methionine (S)-S-oxide reductase MsrA [Sphingobium sp.]